MRQALAEGFTLGVKAGVAPEVLWECMRQGAVGRMLLLHEGLPATVFKGRFEPPSMFLSAGRKDIALATELGWECNVPLPMATLAEQIVVEACARGWQDKDLSIVFLLQEEAAGVQVRAPRMDAKAARSASVHPNAK
ncbi:MAG: NAD-binding protein [Dehalococcoidia bacterium]|nr:NAD-binding protein [Dehalococcoidia bacterium]